MAQNQETDTDQILDLAALAVAEDDRPRVRFPDGAVYKLRSLAGIGILESEAFQERSKRLQAVLTKKKRTPVDAEKLEELLILLTRVIVPDAPADDVKALEEQQMLAIIDRFNKSLPGLAEGSGATPTPLSTTGR